MMIEVEAPDGTIVEFPEGTSREVMQDAMRRRFPQTDRASSMRQRLEAIPPEPSNRGFLTPSQERQMMRGRIERPMLQAEIDLAEAERFVGAPIQIGEAPFKAQMGAAFGMKSAQPLQQMMPDFEFTEIPQGPLKGTQLFRRRNTNEPWTTAQVPAGLTPSEAVSTLAGAAPGIVMGGLGTMAGAALPVPGFLGAGMYTGAAAGEAGRQLIGRGLVGLSPVGPGQPPPRSFATTPEERSSIYREGAIGLVAGALGNAIAGIYKGIRGAGSLPQFNTAEYRAGLAQVQQELERVLGPGEAARAMKTMNAADIASAMNEGGILEAQLQRARSSPTKYGAEITRLEAQKEAYLRDLADRLLRGAGTREVSPTEVGQRVREFAPEVPELPTPAPVAGPTAAAQAEEAGRTELQRRGLEAVEELTAGRAVPTIPGARAVGETVEAAAPRGMDVTGGATVVMPERSRALVKEAWQREADALRRRTGEPFTQIEEQVADVEVTPDALASVAERYRERLSRRLFPSVSPEDQPVVDNFFRRAFGEPLEEGAPPPLLPRTYQELRDDVSNLKAAIRRTDKGFSAGDVRMLRDFVDAAESDIGRILETSGGPQLAAQYNEARAAFREAMDLIERSGAAKFGALRTGGGDVVSDEKVVSRIWGNADESAAMSQMLSSPESAPAREAIKSGLLWELQRRAAPGVGGNVSPGSLQNAMRDSETILENWFTPREIAQLPQRAAEIQRLRRFMGVDDQMSHEKWFDEKFWGASPEAAQRTIERLQEAARQGLTAATATIEMIQNMTRQRIYNQFVSRDETGARAFDATKFFNDILENSGRMQYYTAVFGPQFAARSRMLADDLSTFAKSTAQQVKLLRQQALTDEATNKNAMEVAKAARNTAIARRQALGFGQAVENPTMWFDRQWTASNAENMREVMSAIDEPTRAAVQNLALNRIWREITSRGKPTVKGAVTDRPQTAIDENKLVELVSTPERREWMRAVFGSDAAAYGQLDRLVAVMAMLKPDQAKVILSNVSDPALISLEQARRARNVIFGPLSPKSRITTRMMEWGGDRLRARAAEALISPQRFIELQEAGKRTPLGYAAAGTVTNPLVQYLTPDSVIQTMGRVSEQFGVQLPAYQPGEKR
jgi:hypothetical protein